MATPIQFWKQYANHIPPTAVGDNIFFGLDTTDPAKGSVYVTDNQGKVVKCGENYDKQINILSVDRGYVTTKVLDGLYWWQVATLHGNGKYVLRDGQGMPNGDSVQSTYLIEVIKMNDSYYYVEAICIWSPNNTKAPARKYWGVVLSGEPNGWFEVATTTKLQLPLKNGWTQQNGTFEQAVSVSGGEAIISMLVYNSLQTLAHVAVATTPYPPGKSQIMKGFTNDGHDVVFTIDQSRDVTILGTPPAHSWISLVAPYIL